MKAPIVIALFCGAASILEGQTISPPVSDKFPFQIGIIMDGGTIYILERATTETPERRYCIDKQINSGTAGELFVGNLHPTQEGAKRVQADESTKVFERLEARLKEFHGDETLERYRTEPIDLEALSEGAAEEMARDPGFNDRVATQMLLEAIQEYRETHDAKQGRAGQSDPAADPKAERESK